LHILNHREWRGGSHDADIGRRLQAAMPNVNQKARRGRAVRLTARARSRW